MTASAGLVSWGGIGERLHPARLYRALTAGANGVGSVWFFGLMFLICADILGRTLFLHPIKGVVEIVAHSVAACVFLGLAQTLHAGRFTRSEILLDAVGKGRPWLRGFYEALFALAGAAISFALLYGLTPEFLGAWRKSEIVGVPGWFTFTIWPFRLILVFGAATMLVEYVLQFLHGAGETLRHAAARPRPIALMALVNAVLIGGALWLAFDASLSNRSIGFLSIGAMMALILGGMHIGVALMSLSFLGIWLMRGDPALGLNTITLAADEYLVNYVFSVVPLFVIMGIIVSVAGIGADTFDVARQGLRRIKGGLGVATVAANAVFAAITGTSIASAALFAKISAPEMMRQGYSARFSVGVVAGSSVLGMLIPPSLLLIVYGFIAEQSVGILFTASIVPGIVLALAYAVAIVLMAHAWPAYVGSPRYDARGDGMGAAQAARKLGPIVVLIGLVLGGIYGGFFTPTEAAAAGALGALVFALARRSLTWSRLAQVMVESSYITVSVLFLILGANAYARMLALSGVPQHMSSLIASLDLGFAGFIVSYVLFLLFLGTILDSISIMLITLPLALPVVKAMGGDLIWFGVVTVIAVEVGLLTPPFGISCFVVKSSLNDPRVSLRDIFAGAFPFVVIMLAVTLVVILFPGLTRVFV